MKNGDNFHGIVIQWDINGITLWLCQNSYWSHGDLMVHLMGYNGIYPLVICDIAIETMAQSK